MTLDEIRALPPLAAAFPVVFENRARFEQFHGECGKCKERIPQGEMRGSVSRAFHRVALVDALGYCPPCDMVTPFRYRLHDDFTMSGRSPQTGEWVRWGPRPATLLERIRRLLRAVFQEERKTNTNRRNRR